MKRFSLGNLEKLQFFEITLSIFMAGIILSLSGCSDFFDTLKSNSNNQTENPDYDIITPTETKTVAYSSGEAITVDPTTKTLTVTGDLGGKTVYLAKTNPTGTLIASKNSQAVKNATNMELNKASPASGKAYSARAAQEESFEHEGYQCASAKLYEKYSNVTFGTPRDSGARAAATAQTIDRSKSQLDLVVGKTQKDIWVATDVNLSTFEHLPATLRAKGTYCNVWVLKDCWTTGSASGKQIDNALAEKMAAFFDQVYALETNLYGKESDQIFYLTEPVRSLTRDSFALENMEKLSDTGTKVNLVVCDIGGDYGKDIQSGILGYFTDTDYYPDLKDLNTMTGQDFEESDYPFYNSNEGKYLYIDAPSCVSAVSNVMTIITHEYQHLITWGRKTMNHYASKGYILADSAYYEMMAMVGEDFMKEYTKGLYSEFTNDNTPFAWRLPSFNTNYLMSGIEYRTDDDGKYVSVSYSTNYAFGAWLARTYGGAALMYDIVNNTEGEYFPAVQSSIETVTGTPVSIESLLKGFVWDCIVSKDNAGFRKHVELSSSEKRYCADKAYGYPLTKVDLYNLENYGVSTTVTDSEGKTITRPGLTGPFFWDYNKYYSEGIRPYGFEFNKIGTVYSGATSITITFGLDAPASTLKSYLIIE